MPSRLLLFLSLVFSAHFLSAQVGLSNSISIDIFPDSTVQTIISLTNSSGMLQNYRLTTAAANEATEPYADRISLSRTTGSLRPVRTENIEVSIDMLDIRRRMGYAWKIRSVDGNGNTDSLTITVNVMPPMLPTAEFSTGDTISCSGAIAFTNETLRAEPFTSYKWMFGDGETSTEEEPTHSYSASGIYTVTLIACNGPQCDTLIRPDYIEVTATIPGCESYVMEPDRTTKLLDACHIQAYDTGGSGGDYLPNTTNNLWIRGGNNNSRIRITFDQFELGSGASISVSDSDANLNNGLIATYDSDNPPPPVLESSRNFIFVTFRAGPEAAPGFSLRTECIEPILTIEDTEAEVVITGCGGEANFRVFPVFADHTYEYIMPDGIVVKGIELTNLIYAFTTGGIKDVQLLITSPEGERVIRDIRINLGAGAPAGSIAGPDNLRTGQSGNFRFTGSPTFAAYRWYTSDGRRFDNQSARISWDEPGTYFLYAASNGPNECQYAAIKMVTVDWPTSVGSQEGESEFLVFPNPVNEELVVSGKLPYTNTVRYHILDMSGKVVKEGNHAWFSGNEFLMNVRVSDLPQGSYLINIMNENGRRFGVRHFVKI